MIDWVFDDPDNERTMTACPNTVFLSDNNFASGRFDMPNLFRYWYNPRYSPDNLAKNSIKYGIVNRPNKYAYNIGTWYITDYWTGRDGNIWGFANLFEYVPKEVMQDAREQRALLIIDSTNEGCQIDWLWEFWHQSCEKYNIPPQCILHVTGNLLESRGYNSWADEKQIKNRISIVGFSHSEHQVRLWADSCKRDKQRLLDLSAGIEDLKWEDHIEYKRSNLSEIKTFNCLNRYRRQHREFFLLNLIQSDLVQHGLVSHDVLEWEDWLSQGISPDTLELAKKQLPLVVDDPDFEFNKVMKINHDISLKSWLSVITETHAIDESHHLFISEKIIKPINSLQPFMVLGHRDTLKVLHTMGYRTFHPLIDESYDDQPFDKRVEIILDNIRRIHAIKDKMSWLEQFKEICMHNKQVFHSRKFFATQAYRDIMAVYDNFNG